MLALVFVLGLRHGMDADHIATIDALEDKLRGAKVGFSFHRYLAQHGFANETAIGPHRIAITQYDAAWSQIAWDRTLRFFGQHLG